MSQRSAVCSVFQHHVRVKQYLHSDCAFFGHSLVHPNEGHVVVKVIDRALERKSERQREKIKRETWSINRLTEQRQEGTREARGYIKNTVILNMTKIKKKEEENLLRTS